MKITVASGKGGTGKSMVAANLAWSLSGSGQVTLVDCDVEEPNLHLFFREDPSTGTVVTVDVPCIDTNRCTRCAECARFCAFGALVVTRERVLFFPEQCHSCGGCAIVCPAGAITETPRPIGRITTRGISPSLHLVTGTLSEGEVLAVKVIREAKEAAGTGEWVIFDASPGTSCPVVETLEGSDFCILVTESTPFGLHDLALAHDVTIQTGIPSGVVINRSDGKDEAAHRFCEEHEIPVLAVIPFERKIAEIQGSGDLISRRNAAWYDRFQSIGRLCRSLVEGA
ncbi:MAG: P-loop NTPase [Methanomicrobiales archaeon]|nr:P-loop NTPase [Methanomicrobiales archaeon]NYT21910.1 P-loop NTPase [Methanomicrobiales archaeon]